MDIFLVDGTGTAPRAPVMSCREVAAEQTCRNSRSGTLAAIAPKAPIASAYSLNAQQPVRCRIAAAALKYPSHLRPIQPQFLSPASRRI
jgi:hypothetical protein